MAALQNFVDNSLPTIKAAWLNAIDAFHNTLFAGATTVAQARDALEITAQPTFRNRVINGRMQQAQFSNSVTSGTAYICDMWLVGSGGTGTWTGSRVQAVGLTDFPYFIRILSGAANTVSAGSYWALEHRMEGVLMDDFNWGTSAATTVTLSFWARVSVPGTYSVAIRNASAARSYVTTFTATSNAWAKYTITIPGDTTGTWNGPASNLIGMTIDFIASCGTTYTTSTTNAWIPGNFIAANTQTQLMETNGASFDITGVQLEKGAIATSYEMIPVQAELNRCQRYYETSAVLLIGYAPVAPMAVGTHINERVIKRATPAINAITVVSVVGVSNASFGYVGNGPPHIQLTIGVAAATYAYQIVASIDARL
jgi:hypothetical protein